MALKTMRIKAGFPGEGQVIGVHDDAGPLPPLARNNEGEEISEYIDYVPPAAPPAKGKLQIESETLLPSWSAWWRWKTTLDEITARNLAVPGTYSAAVVTAVTAKVNASFAAYGAEISQWRTAT